MLHKIVVNAYNFWLVVFVSIGTIASAYGLAIIGSTVGQPNFYAYFNLPTQGESGYEHTTNTIGALNGINSAGAILGCLGQAWTADFFGRKRTMQFGCAILIIGGALCAGAVNMDMFLAGRFIAGMGAATLACIVPIYQAEVSTAETRGAMVCVTGIMYAVGYSLAGWLGFACYYMKATSPYAAFAWRFPLAFQITFPLVVLAGSSFIPFSPRWLLQQGRRDEAFEIVRRLHKVPDDPNDTRAKQEFLLMERQFEHDRSMVIRRFEIFRTPANRRRALTAFLLMAGDQFLGIYVIANYGVIIYGYLGFTGGIPLLLNACWTTFTLIGNTWTAFYLDRVGRRTCLLLGSIGCTASAIFLCALSAEYLGTNVKSGLQAAVFFTFFYIFWWCFFMDATQYVYVTEIFPNHLRSQGVAIGLSTFYLTSEVTLVAAPVALNTIGWKFYLVLIIPSVFYIAAIYFLFPETKGRTLEEIGALFGDAENVASRWYNTTEEEREKIAREALSEATDSSHDKEHKPAAVHAESL
ncbi:MFS transporter [Penicillium waksmanii]|uniref:MFS transporter n=1 Tax=Penicillium waksmanii TaxID=69791 RepID=UPI002547ECD4|nr:MFS transporter [Penicillium waksmanii]KAJ5980045.1 MFS transporter [Penicillium waksmanii]